MKKHIEPHDDKEAFEELAVEPTPEIISENDTELDEESLPRDLPGRASSTPDDLTALFGDAGSEQMADGFTGSGDDDGDHIGQNDGDDTPERASRPDGA